MADDVEFIEVAPIFVHPISFLNKTSKPNLCLKFIFYFILNLFFIIFHFLYERRLILACFCYHFHISNNNKKICYKLKYFLLSFCDWAKQKKIINK